MGNTRTFNRSFAGGEISPELYGRIDDAKFQTGAATLRNFIATPQGPAQNRPGFEFVKATKNSGVARLIPFTYSTTQTMVLEFGDSYIRFHTQGATLDYSPTQEPYNPGSNVTISVASPAVVTWNAHGLSNGMQVVFFVPLHIPPYTLPTGMFIAKAYTVANVTANTFTLIDPDTLLPVNTSAPGTAPTIQCYRVYPQGTLVSYSGAVYYFHGAHVGDGSTVPGTDPTVWYPEPVDLTFEIPSPYVAADLFDIHFVQSADVLTLVHPNYPPMELKRLGATFWTLTNILFQPAILPPGNPAVVASPGYKSKIASVTAASPSVFTTQADHTLSIGDSIYVTGAGSLADGFYQVEKAPASNQLVLVDYNGNEVNGVVYVSGGTIQFGSKIYDIVNHYVVTAIGANGVDESAISADVSVLDNLNVSGSFNTISWDVVAGASRYYVYKKKNGLYGFIGTTTGTSFVDNNIGPDMGITPPNYEADFQAANDYPGAVGYFEQRRAFAGTNNQPQNLWMTKSGTESNLSFSLPTNDSDRIAIRVAAREANTIRHIVPLTQLMLLTSSAEIRVSPVNSDAITPTTISAKPQSYIGASNVQPTIVNNSLVYCSARGGHVREMGYQWQANGFVTGDLSLRAVHLFDNMSILDQCFVKAPRQIIWFVSSSGKLLGLTYVPEEQIGAWHQHDTDGVFESIAAVAEGEEDRLYAVIRRTVNSATVRYVERMASRQITTIEDCFFVDAGLTYDGAPATTISGLAHLEGKTVSILADGGVVPQQTVTGGQITLAHAASKVQIGLPYLSDLKTMILVLQIDGFGQGRQKNINKCWLRVNLSGGILVGPDIDHLGPPALRTTEPFGSPPSLRTGEIEVSTMPSWQPDGQLVIRQSDPLPLEIVGLTMEVSFGG